MSQLTASYRSALASIQIIIAAVGLVACHGEPAEVWEQPTGNDQGLMHDLVVPTQFVIAPTSPSGTGSFAAAIGRTAAVREPADVHLAVLGGYFDLRATRDGWLVVQNLEVDISDAYLTPEMVPPSGLLLTAVKISLPTPLVLSPTDQGSRIAVVARLDITAEWALALPSGRIHPLLPVDLESIPFSLEVERTRSGALKARLVAFQQGPFWNWSGFQLADMTLDLSAALAPPGAP